MRSRHSLQLDTMHQHQQLALACRTASALAPSAPSPTWSDTATLVGGNSRPRGERVRTSGSKTKYDPLDVKAARNYARAVADLNVLLCLFDTGFLGQDRDVRMEVLERAVALYAESEARAEGAEKIRQRVRLDNSNTLQGQRYQALPGTTSIRQGLDLAQCHLDDIRSTGLRPEPSRCVQNEALATIAHARTGSYDSIALSKPSRFARLALGSRQAKARQHKRIDEAHEAWESIGVDSRTILACGDSIDGFFDPPGHAKIALPKAVTDKARALGMPLATGNERNGHGSRQLSSHAPTSSGSLRRQRSQQLQVQ
ncbi:unnamed protein product [Parajaminaea phylloscopi]